MAIRKLVEEMEEVKNSLNFTSEGLSTVAKQQMGLLDLTDEVQQLKAVIKDEDLEQNTRIADPVISGPETTYSTCARITGGDEEVMMHQEVNWTPLSNKSLTSSTVTVEFVSS